MKSPRTSTSPTPKDGTAVRGGISRSSVPVQRGNRCRDCSPRLRATGCSLRAAIETGVAALEKPLRFAHVNCQSSCDQPNPRPRYQPTRLSCRWSRKGNGRHACHGESPKFHFSPSFLNVEWAGKSPRRTVCRLSGIIPSKRPTRVQHKHATRANAPAPERVSPRGVASRQQDVRSIFQELRRRGLQYESISAREAH